MSAEPNFLDVKIMGREYRVACSPEELDGLQAAVELVDNKMREIAQRTKSTIAERVAVMAALNIAHEYLSTAPASAEKEIDCAANIVEAKRETINMGRRILPTLATQQQLDL